MAQTIRITITPDVEKALQILRQTTLGTLNTTELIKMAIGSFAKMKLDLDNIAYPEKLKPFIPKPYVRTR